MMLVELTSIPLETLPLAAFRDHLRLGSGFSDDTIQDAVLENFLRAAIASIEARTGKILLERSFGWTLSAWRHDDRQPLPLAPVTSVSALIEVDIDGFEAPMASTWYLAPDDQRPVLKARAGCLPRILPSMNVRVEMTAGFAATRSGVPADLRQAVMMLATHYYEHRSAEGSGANDFPIGVISLIERYRTVRTFLGGRS